MLKYCLDACSMLYTKVWLYTWYNKEYVYLLHTYFISPQCELEQSSNYNFFSLSNKTGSPGDYRKFYTVSKVQVDLTRLFKYMEEYISNVTRHICSFRVPLPKYLLIPERNNSSFCDTADQEMKHFPIEKQNMQITFISDVSNRFY